MKEEWLLPYEQNTMRKDNQYGYPMCIRLPGNTSTSQNLKVGLEFATQNPKPDHVPVLFVFVIQNDDRFSGIRMNNSAYTAYPSEREILLTEGADVYILSVERGVVFSNPHASFTPFNGKSLTIIYLFMNR